MLLSLDLLFQQFQRPRRWPWVALVHAIIIPCIAGHGGESHSSLAILNNCVSVFETMLYYLYLTSRYLWCPSGAKQIIISNSRCCVVVVVDAIMLLFSIFNNNIYSTISNSGSSTEEEVFC